MADDSAQNTRLIPTERIQRAILLIRGQKVMLDRDLADLYGVETKVLIQAVKRNLKRFPGDFMFQLQRSELQNWRSHFVTSNPAARMGLRRLPYAFTEQGVAMLSSVVRSDRAVEVNVEIMRAFVRLRQMLASHADLASNTARTFCAINPMVALLRCGRKRRGKGTERKIRSSCQPPDNSGYPSTLAEANTTVVAEASLVRRLSLAEPSGSGRYFRFFAPSPAIPARL